MPGGAINKPFGSYLVQEKVGSGGVAKVYKAIDRRTNETVALKVMHSIWGEKSDVARRFQKEAEIVKKLQHPCIVAVYDYGIIRGRTYLVMQYMPGGCLSERFQDPVPVTSQEVVRLLRRIASALDHAHRKEVIHRDLKLENILLDERGDAALSDFGIARVKDSKNLTMTGSIVGTPMYMSPEQARGKRQLDYRSDLYSLAVMSYLLTVGRFPFVGNDLLAILQQHVNAPPPPPSEIAPDLPRGLDNVLLRGLAKKPSERYPSADAFIEAYARVMSDYAPRQTLVDMTSEHLLLSESQVDATVDPWSVLTADELVEQAEATQDEGETIELLRRALDDDPWHMQANRMLHKLEDVKSIYAEKAAPVITEPLPEMERNIRQTAQDRRRERRRAWTRLGCMGGLLLGFACTLFTFNMIGLLPGFITAVTTLMGGPTPVTEIDGVPVEEVPDAVIYVPPSQSKTVTERDVDVLEHGYNHEFTFHAQAGEEVAVYVQFMSLSAHSVTRNVAILDPYDNNYVNTCQQSSILEGDDNNVAYLCKVNTTGEWAVRILGLQGESTGAYFVGVERLQF
jgi:serine/threonine protein kinase